MLELIGAMGIPFVGALAGFFALLGFFLAVYAVYDIVLQQDEMILLEQLIWVAVVLSFNLLGVIVYFLVVHSQDRHLFDEDPFRDEVGQLERLQRLHEDGALTDEEFQREKEKLLGD